MEHTGQVGKIQASEETANVLMNAGKADWVRPREDKINPKGKGQMRTFWVEPKVDLEAQGKERCTSPGCPCSGAPTIVAEQAQDRPKPSLMPLTRQRSGLMALQRQNSL